MGVCSSCIAGAQVAPRSGRKQKKEEENGSGNALEPQESDRGLGSRLLPPLKETTVREATASGSHTHESALPTDRSSKSRRRGSGAAPMESGGGTEESKEGIGELGHSSFASSARHSDRQTPEPPAAPSDPETNVPLFIRDYGSAPMPRFDPSQGLGCPGGLVSRHLSDIEQEYETVGLLGAGAFGEVLLARRRKDGPDGERVAVKKIKPDVRSLARNAAKKVLRTQRVARMAFGARTLSGPREASEAHSSVTSGAQVIAAAVGVVEKPEAADVPDPAKKPAGISNDGGQVPSKRDPDNESDKVRLPGHASSDAAVTENTSKDDVVEHNESGKEHGTEEEEKEGADFGVASEDAVVLEASREVDKDDEFEGGTKTKMDPPQNNLEGETETETETKTDPPQNNFEGETETETKPPQDNFEGETKTKTKTDPPQNNDDDKDLPPKDALPAALNSSATKKPPPPPPPRLPVSRSKVIPDSTASQSRVVAATKATAHAEAECMHRVRGHPHVVELLDVLEDARCVYLVMEHCSGGDLMKYVKQSKHFSEKVASFLFGQMLEGVAHCHSRGVVHRDLKPDNFLFLSHTGKVHLKIADFGLAATIASPDEEMTDAVGSAFFLAPEVLSRRYDRSCDAWSLGVNLYLLLSGTVPFGATATKASEVYEAVKKERLRFTGRAWAQVGSAARELVAGLLERDPRKRYTLAQAMQHPWVRLAGVAADIPLDRAIISAMYHFNATNRLRREALRVVAASLSADDLQRLRRQFHRIDRDTDNAISLAELTEAMAEMGLNATEAQLRALMREMDTDGDGRIDLEEFLTATAELHMVQHQNEIWWAFCEYDRNGDGTITIEEMRDILKNEADDDIRKYMEEYDIDGDGTINYEEWVRMVVPPDIEFQTVSFT